MRKALVVGGLAVTVLAGVVIAQITRTKAPEGASVYIVSPANNSAVGRTFTVPFLTPARDTAARTSSVMSCRDTPGALVSRSSCVYSKRIEHDAARARERGRARAPRRHARRGGAAGRTSAEVSVVIL